MCEYAPSSMRTSASSASARALAGVLASDGAHAGSTRVSARTPARHADAGHRPLAFGLHLVEHERAVGGHELGRRR